MKLFSIICLLVVILLGFWNFRKPEASPKNSLSSQAELAHYHHDSKSGVLTITQSSQTAIVNINGLNVSDLKFKRPPGAITIIRDTGGSPSRYFGKLEANGSLMVINPNGVMIGPAGIINLDRGLTFSTLDSGVPPHGTDRQKPRFESYGDVYRLTQRPNP